MLISDKICWWYLNANQEDYTLRGMVISILTLWRVRQVEIETKTGVSKDMLLKRLKRVEGQLRGIHKMIAEDRDCVSIVMQLAAVRSGVEGVGALVLNNCMKLCFLKGPDATTNIDSLSKAVAIWGRVRGGDSK
jgi:DNA-binding FrmR family transcriptional regulator